MVKLMGMVGQSNEKQEGSQVMPHRDNLRHPKGLGLRPFRITESCG